MYAKLFTSIYQGTLRGNSHGLLVFTNLLAHADKTGQVDIHPRAVAEEVGLTVDQVRAAIEVLEAPDAESRSPEEEGRRLLRLDEHRAWGWVIVNYVKYRSIRSEDDRREQNRLAQEAWRAKHKKSKPPSADVSRDKPPSAHTEVDSNTEEEATKATSKTTLKRSPAAPSLTVEALCVDGLAADLAAEYLAMRERKRARLTARAWAGVAAEIRKAGLSLDDGIAKALARGWVGFEAAWVASDATGRGVGVGVNRQEAQEARNRAVGEAWAEKMQAMENCDARG